VGREVDEGERDAGVTGKRSLKKWRHHAVEA
jgi:hypothetical protein